jgi:4-amino-4-deoxy-L-arabinose transferase
VLRRIGWLSVVPIVVYILAYVLLLGVRPVSSPDESRYAEVPREMLASGDWVVPRLNGLRYFEKPPLGYWLNAVSQEVLGPTAFAMRLPSALSAGAVALLVALLLSRAFKNSFVTITGVLASLTMLELYACGTLNILDGPFSLFVTVTLTCGYLAVEAKERRQERRWLVMAGVGCGLAFLTKGFLAIVLPVSVLLPYLAWQGRLRDVFRLSWLPGLVALLVVGPWAWAIAVQESDFWRYFFMEQHVRRFGSEKAQHAEPVWFFLPILIAGSLPWAFLLPSVIKNHVKAGFQSPLTRFAVCWLIFPLLFFSMSRGKLSTYILPVFPALALLIGSAARELFGEQHRRGFRLGCAVLGYTFGALGAAILLGAWLGPFGLDVLSHPPGSLWGVGVGFLAWGGLALLAGRASQPAQKLTLFAMAPVLLFMLIPFSMPPDLPKRFPGETLAVVADRVDAQTVLISDRSYVQAMCWVMKRADILLLGKAGEVKYGLEHSETERHLKHADLDEMLRDPARSYDVVFVIDDENHKRYLAHPEPDWQIERPGMLAMGFDSNL